KALDSHRARQAAVAAAAARIQAERAEAEAEAAALDEHAAALASQLDAEASRRRELEEALPALLAAEDEERRREAAWQAGTDNLDRRWADVSAARRDHDLRAAAVAERRRGLIGRLEEVDARLEHHGEARRAAEER